MRLISALSVARILSMELSAEEIPFVSVAWFAYAGFSCFLVLFAGIMSGLTLGLMSLGLVELEILQRSGTETEKKQAAAILPVVQKQHQLLVTLLLCNAAAMEALPLYLDKLFNQYVAIILSVTFVLAFGEVIPQAICTRYGLAVGANFLWLVRVLMIVCYPIAYPIGKVALTEIQKGVGSCLQKTKGNLHAGNDLDYLDSEGCLFQVLDYVLGHHEALFRRAQLKALVSIHSKEAGKGGELTHDETTIISGALDLTEKTAEEAMTPIESTFSLDVNSKLDWEAMGKVLARGHSRVPVYSGSPRNIIGLLLVKSLLTVRPKTETPVSAVSIRRIPRVPADMPLYDILNEFQKGSSHMAAVVKSRGKVRKLPSAFDADKTKDNLIVGTNTDLTTPLLSMPDEKPENVVLDIDRMQKPGNMSWTISSEGVESPINGMPHLADDVEDGEVIGIITLEDVFEELLQEEIVDETDEYVDVHKRIRVVAAAAASSVARAPSTRSLNANKGAAVQSNAQRKPADDKTNPAKPQGTLTPAYAQSKS